MKKSTKAIIAIVIGLVGFLAFSYMGRIDPELVENCQQQVTERYGEDDLDMMDRCESDVGFIAMMDTSENAGANAMAQSISRANNSELNYHFIRMAFLGVLVAGLIGLIATLFGKKKEN